MARKKRRPFASSLKLLAKSGSYIDSTAVLERWGQLLRQDPDIAAWLRDQETAEVLVRLGELGRIRGGAVTRANAYFLVEEIPFGEIPSRFRITRSDFARVAVVRDGLGTVHRIEREYLREVVKGPEALITPVEVAESPLRLFYVTASKEELRQRRATGALEYLRRGETKPYNTSGDSLKGGIPAKRAQVKIRKPYWYSISVSTYRGPRILLPEHLDLRYVCTLLEDGDERIVIDKLFTWEPLDKTHAPIVHASLNSILTWYQLELRGRTQLGQGVLELKKADWSGVLVLNPAKLAECDREALLKAFEPLLNWRDADTLNSAGDARRVAFDEELLRLAGAEDPAGFRLRLERETRNAANERHERRASVAEAKALRGAAARSAMSIEAYAVRIAGKVEPFPDPRQFVAEDVPTWPVEIQGPVEGPIRIGVELFDQGKVYAGAKEVAAAPDSQGAEFVAGVLRVERGATKVDVPLEPHIREIIERYRKSVTDWEQRFQKAANEVLRGIGDERLRNRVIDAARSLCAPTV